MSSFCFELQPKINRRNFLDNSQLSHGYTSLLAALGRFSHKFTFSLRCLYDPLSDQKLRTFILVNGYKETELDKGILSVVSKGNLSRFFDFNYQENGFPDVGWTNSIAEITKRSEIINQPGFLIYLPHLFETSRKNNEFSILDLLDSASYTRLVLELSLKAHNSSAEQANLINALQEITNRLSKSLQGRSDHMQIDRALSVYRKYQELYSNNDLFNYSIKVLGENLGDTFTILQSWLESATDDLKRANLIPIITSSIGEARFTSSLRATQEIDIADQIEWNGWQKEPGQSLQYKLIKDTISSGGLLAGFDDGSLNFPIIPSFRSSSNQKNLNSSGEVSNQSNNGDLVLGGTFSISKLHNSNFFKVEHLKSLSQVVTYQEVSAFLEVFECKNMAQSSSSLHITAEEVFNKYHHLITPDDYIVGIDDKGNPVISSWADIPHRLVAGQTGFGKTNFIQWIIFQFFYANPTAKIYAMDFKGVDFPDLKFFLPNFHLEVVTEVEDALGMLDMIDAEEKQRSLLINQHPGARSLSDLRNKGVPIHRTLWIIDEAADIADASYNLAESIEKRLKKYARKGRSFGIHMVYAAQRPDGTVISRQVTDQLGEKTVFKVTASASVNIIEIDHAERIDRKGRAILHRDIGNWFYVNTPVMPDLSKTDIHATVWSQILSQS